MSYCPGVVKLLKANPNQFTYLELAAKFSHSVTLLHQITLNNYIGHLVSIQNQSVSQKTINTKIKTTISTKRRPFDQRPEYGEITKNIVEAIKTGQFTITELMKKFNLSYIVIKKVIDLYELESYTKLNNETQIALQIKNFLQLHPNQYLLSELSKKYDISQKRLKNWLANHNCLELLITKPNKKNKEHEQILDTIKYFNRTELIVKARELGISYELIGRKLGYMKQRIQQIYAEEMKIFFISSKLSSS